MNLAVIPADSSRLAITWGLIVGGSLLLLILMRWTKHQKSKLPPGPVNWPVVGALLNVGPLIHRSMADLAKKHGPIFYMEFGNAPVVVISSPTIAEELYKEKEKEFASRPTKTLLKTSGKYIGFECSNIAGSNYTPTLRIMRKLASAEFFAKSGLNATEKYRKQEIQFLLNKVLKASKEGELVDMRVGLRNVTRNVLSQMILGRRIFDTGVPLGPGWEDFEEVYEQQITVSSQINLADLHPVLGWISSNAVLRNFQNWSSKATPIFAKLMDDHRKARKANQAIPDFLDKMLACQEEDPDKITDLNIMGAISDSFVGGSDTSSTAAEWLMFELIRHPLCMDTLREEIDTVVGKDRLVEDSDLANLPYLEALVKENFRLHNPVPMLLPRTNVTPQTLAGYDIPPHTAVFFNTFASSHDPSLWKHPFNFYPDRFLGNNLGLNGNHLKLAPFGSGRRVCVGLNLGLSVIQGTVATLVQAFDWSPPPGVSRFEMKDEEAMGIVSHLKHPLFAAAVPRVDPSSMPFKQIPSKSLARNVPSQQLWPRPPQLRCPYCLISASGSHI